MLAIHWHPEFIPMPLISKRLEAMYPAKRRSLIIPTQHNATTTCSDYAGVEIDCYSRGINQKVQLLLHFVKSRLEKDDLLKVRPDTVRPGTSRFCAHLKGDRQVGNLYPLFDSDHHPGGFGRQFGHAAGFGFAGGGSVSAKRDDPANIKDTDVLNQINASVVLTVFGYNYYIFRSYLYEYLIVFFKLIGRSGYPRK